MTQALEIQNELHSVTCTAENVSIKDMDMWPSSGSRNKSLHNLIRNTRDVQNKRQTRHEKCEGSKINFLKFCSRLTHTNFFFF